MTGPGVREEEAAKCRSRRSASARLVRVALVVACVGAFDGAGVAPATALKPPKPVISGLAAEPASVASGGTTTLSATVSGALTCTLSSTARKPVAGLPASFSCESGSLHRALVMPENKGPRAAVYTLTVTAVGAGGSTSAKVTVTVRAPWTEVTGSGLQVAAGAAHSCAVVSTTVSTGNVLCWGFNRYGQLGDASTSWSAAPVQVHGITNAVQAAAGEEHSCAVLATGHVDCWGLDDEGQLGDGSSKGPQRCNEMPCSRVPVEVQGITDAIQVTAGRLHTCALLATGHVYCWGSDYYGQLGIGNSTYGSQPSPVEVKGITEATQLGAGLDHTCATLSSGHVDCWGANGYGQLGDGTSSGPEVCYGYAGPCSTTAVEAQGITNAIGVSGGGAEASPDWRGGSTCTALATGQVDCWGANDDGQLGDGTFASSDTPMEVQGISSATQVSAGGTHACAVLAGGHIDCWGADEDGQLGNDAIGEPPGIDVPVEVKAVTDASHVVAGFFHTCALLQAGQVDCWGWNVYGQAPPEVPGIF